MSGSAARRSRAWRSMASSGVACAHRERWQPRALPRGCMSTHTQRCTHMLTPTPPLRRHGAHAHPNAAANEDHCRVLLPWGELRALGSCNVCGSWAGTPVGGGGRAGSGRACPRHRCRALHAEGGPVLCSWPWHEPTRRPSPDTRTARGSGRCRRWSSSCKRGALEARFSKASKFPTALPLILLRLRPPGGKRTFRSGWTPFVGVPPALL